MGVGNRASVNPTRPELTFFCEPLPSGHAHGATDERPRRGQKTAYACEERRSEAQAVNPGR